jgi:hypothetical protein
MLVASKPSAAKHSAAAARIDARVLVGPGRLPVRAIIAS